MALRDELRSKLTQAMKGKDEQAKNLLRLVIGEVDTVDARQGKCADEAADTQRIAGVIKKIMEGNAETIRQIGKILDPRVHQLIQENSYLKQLLPPTLSDEELRPILAEVADNIKSAKNEGQATGIAMKHLKTKGVANAESSMVIALVKELRG